jgi:hypothetical protein
MSETYEENDYVSPETGEIQSDPDPDVEKNRVIIPVDHARPVEKKQVVPPKKEAVKKQIPMKPEGRKVSPRLRRASRSSTRNSQVPKATSANPDIKKFTMLVPDDLLRKFRMQALQDGMTYSALGVEAIQGLLRSRNTTPAKK